MKARAHHWSADKKAAAIAREKAPAEEKAAKEAERRRRTEVAAVAVLDKRGGRVRWNTCGERLCSEAGSNQGNLYDFRSGWTTHKGNMPLVILRGY